MKRVCYSLAMIVMLLSVSSCKDSKQTTLSESKVEHEDAAIPSKKTTPSIVPGERLEGIVLGEPATKILDSLGRPPAGDAAMGKALGTWPVKDGDGDASLDLFTITKMGIEDFSRIQQIRTTAKMYKDAHQLGVGDSLSTFQSAYSLTKFGSFKMNGSSYDLYETTKGMALEVDLNNLVTAIVIHAPDKPASQTYLPFYDDFKSVSEN